MPINNSFCSIKLRALRASAARNILPFSQKRKLVFIGLLLFSGFFSPFAFAQSDSTKTKIYNNDALALRLDSSAEKISIDDVNYFLKCSFTHNKTRGKKKQPYYWNVFLKSSKSSTLPSHLKLQKLYILTDTLIYEYTYLPSTFCWNKTSDLYQKPLTVVVEFLDTKTNRRYFVKAKGPFPTKH